MDISPDDSHNNGQGSAWKKSIAQGEKNRFLAKNSSANKTIKNSMAKDKKQSTMHPNAQTLKTNEGGVVTANFVMDTGTDDIHKYEKESATEKIKAQGVKAVNAA
eukprot:11059436-Ditylum_brightwellii.AAC.1